MKNLFYVCLVAMLSLGSTGYTMVEETGNFESTDCSQGCTDFAIGFYDFLISSGYSMAQASESADYLFEDCAEGFDEPEIAEPFN